MIHIFEEIVSNYTSNHSDNYGEKTYPRSIFFVHYRKSVKNHLIIILL